MQKNFSRKKNGNLRNLRVFKFFIIALWPFNEYVQKYALQSFIDIMDVSEMQFETNVPHTINASYTKNDEHCKNIGAFVYMHAPLTAKQNEKVQVKIVVFAFDDSMHKAPPFPEYVQLENIEEYAINR